MNNSLSILEGTLALYDVEHDGANYELAVEEDMDTDELASLVDTITKHAEATDGLYDMSVKVVSGPRDQLYEVAEGLYDVAVREWEDRSKFPESVATAAGATAAVFGAAVCLPEMADWGYQVGSQLAEYSQALAMTADRVIQSVGAVGVPILGFYGAGYTTHQALSMEQMHRSDPADRMMRYDRFMMGMGYDVGAEEPIVLEPLDE